MTSLFKRIVFLISVTAFLAGCISPVPPASTNTPVPTVKPVQTVTPLPTKPGPSPVHGAPGIGDPYYPTLGNGGYDVQHYTITLDIDPPANMIEGSTTIAAQAKEFLDTFNLDFYRLTIDSINVNGEPATFSRKGDELTIQPAKPLDADKSFTTIINYHGSPGLITPLPAPFTMGWSHADSGAINVWSEPTAAAVWFPNNNHPRDKATYRFEITVPQPWIVAATGTLKETNEAGDKTTYIWEMDHPMATYLASINIDQYDLLEQSGPDGVRIRSYYPVDFPSSRRIQFNILPTAIDFLSDLFGPYPFDEYGVVIAPQDGLCEQTEVALETQSLSLHCPTEIMTSEWVIVHELAHQWFGDSVSLENWKDLWLKEGFATYAEWLWDSNNDLAALNQIAKDQKNFFSDNPDFSVAEPPKNDIYTIEAYVGGALVFHALRLEVGDETFFKIMQTYAEQFRYGNAGSDEFIAVAEEVSGKDLTAFFNDWLFSETMPELPE